MEKPVERFTLDCQLWADGRLRVCSDDIPGLVLSGTDAREVLRDLWPAIQHIKLFNDEEPQG